MRFFRTARILSPTGQQMSSAYRMPTRLALSLFALLALIAGAIPPAHAHDPGEHAMASPQAPAEGAAFEAFAGTVHVVVIEDRAAGTTARFVSMRLADGTSVGLKGASIDGLANGAQIQAIGQRNGNTLFIQEARLVAQGAVRVGARAVQSRETVGTLKLAHADYFAEGRSEFMFAVVTDSGEAVMLNFDTLPDTLQTGMRVSVTGTMGADGASVRPDTVVVLANAPVKTAADVSPQSTTSNVLVILVYYHDQAIPFTQASVVTTYGGGPGSGSVAEYYKEVSYGQQMLNVTVTPWMQSANNKPSDCPWQTTVTTDGNNLAATAGYNVGSYQKVVYVFPDLGCGWAGLAWVSGSQSYINGYNYVNVYGHELGHNFGLLHAGSLACTNGVIGGSCTATEYGDPFVIMGNQSAMHINVAQKDYLRKYSYPSGVQWITNGSVLTQLAGVGAYNIAPLEIAGGTTFGVTVPTRTSRTYWIEYRQPIGFDAGLTAYPNNGAQVRVASPLEWSNGGDDTEILDMTPGTATPTDGALLIGKNFVDPTTGVSISVIGSTPTNLKVLVQMNSQPIVADFNGDGKADLLWRNPGTGETLMQLMNGNTVIGGGSLMINANWAVTNVGDFNGDGKSDLIWRNTTTGETAMWLMNGPALLGGGSLMTNPAWMITQVADFNGDGKADLLWRNLTTGETVIWLMNGTNIIGGGSIMSDPTWIASYVGDFNGDGKADIIWRNIATGATAMWLMNGASLISGGGIMADPNWTVTHVGDFNGDGKSDLVWRNTNTGATALWLMNGTTLLGGAALLSDPNWHVTHVADLNGDGKADLIWRNLSSGQTAAWLMNGLAISSGAGLLSYYNTVTRTGDFDGNGKADIIWRNTSTNQTTMWLMNGATPAAGFSLTTDANWFVQP
jgi:FG-GAP-like repeat/Gametolysin peptidase M11